MGGYNIVGGEEMAIQHASFNDIPSDAALLILQVKKCVESTHLYSMLYL